jgi:hypothetical protein
MKIEDIKEGKIYYFSITSGKVKRWYAVTPCFTNGILLRLYDVISVTIIQSINFSNSTIVGSTLSLNIISLKEKAPDILFKYLI